MPAILRWREKGKVKEKEDEVLSRDVAGGRRTGPRPRHVTSGRHITPLQGRLVLESRKSKVMNS